MARFNFLKKLFSEAPELEKTAKLSSTAERIAEKSLSPQELRQYKEAAEALDKERQLQAWLAMEKAPKDIIAQSKEAALAPQKAKLDEIRRARDLSGFENWAEGGPTTQQLKQLRQKEFELGKEEGVKDIDLNAYFQSLSPSKKAAALAAASTAGLALDSEEAEAGFPGSVAARKKILEKTEKAMDAWTSGKKAAGGGRELREVLQGQLDLDPTGAAKNEALRRLAARTEVRQNPTTGEHEFKVYRGDVKDRAGKTAQSFTTNPDVAQEFADAYGGQVRETWLPASKVGSIPSIMKEGQYLSSEGEVIAKPFKAESALYTAKEPTLHQRISTRGTSKEAPEEADDFISEMLSEAPSAKKKAAGIAAAAGLGSLTLSNQEAKASEIAKKYLGNPEEERKKIAESLNTAGEFMSPFSKLYQLLSPTDIAPEGEEFEMPRKPRK
jgi:hypothetical protein